MHISSISTAAPIRYARIFSYHLSVAFCGFVASCACAHEDDDRVGGEMNLATVAAGAFHYAMAAIIVVPVWAGTQLSLSPPALSSFHARRCLFGGGEGTF
jgi:hypothetical protein